MYNRIGVNKTNINCYNSNSRGLLSNCHFILSSVVYPILPALLHFSAGFFMSKI